METAIAFGHETVEITEMGSMGVELGVQIFLEVGHGFGEKKLCKPKLTRLRTRPLSNDHHDQHGQGPHL